MLVQSENTTRSGGQTMPLNMQTGNRSHKHWLGLAIALIVVAALLVSGIWLRIRARTT